MCRYSYSDRNKWNSISQFPIKVKLILSENNYQRMAFSDDLRRMTIQEKPTSWRNWPIIKETQHLQENEISRKSAVSLFDFSDVEMLHACRLKTTS